MTEPEPGPETSDLKTAYRELQAAGSNGCPAPETLVALATGELAGEERQRAADHVVRCRACSESAQILLQAHAESGGRPRGSRARLGLLASVAAAAAVALLAARLLIAPRPAPSIERGPSAAVQVVPADGASLVSAPDQFAWPAEPEAEAYRVKLFDDTGELLWQSESTREPHVVLPPVPRDLLKAGRSYFWTVDVEGRTDKPRLGPFPFAIRRR